MTDMLAKAKELNEKRTQGKWRWLTQRYVSSERVWRYVEPEEYSDDLQLTAAEVGDLHGSSKDGIPQVLKSTSAGYGGETDIIVSPEDKAFIAFAPEFVDWAIPEFEALARSARKDTATILKLREALEWYADPATWFEDHPKVQCSNAEDDQGQRAREALK